MKPYNLFIPANSEEEFPIPGDFVRLSANSAFNVTVRDRENDNLAELEPGDGVTMPSAFRRIAISHNEATDQFITLNIGFGVLHSSQVAGVVSVPAGIVSSSAVLMKGGSAFYDSHAISPVSSKYGYVAFSNPAGSGVLMVIDSLIVTSTLGVWPYRKATAALFGSTAGQSNRLVGGAAPVTRCSYGTDTGVNIGTEFPTTFGSLIGPVSNDEILPGGLVLDEDSAICFYSGGANTQFNYIANWHEEIK